MFKLCDLSLTSVSPDRDRRARPPEGEGGAIPARLGGKDDRFSVHRARFLAVAALTLCFAAQYLFTGEVFTRDRDTTPRPIGPRQVAGLLLLGLAVGTAARAARPEAAEPEPGGREAAAGGGVERTPFPEALAILAAAASLAAILVGGETPFVRRAWAGGMLLFFLPLAGDFLRARKSRRIAWGEVAVVLAVTAFGFWLRFDKLTELPDDIHRDVALMGRVTRDMMESGDPHWFGLAESAHLLSNHQILALGMRAFGVNHFGLVILSVLAGTATLPLVYLLARRLAGKRAAFLATLILATNYTHIHFSRTLFGPVATLFVTMGVLFLVRGFETGARADFGFAGGTFAAAVYAYDSSRVGPILLVVALLADVVRGRLRGGPALRRWGAVLAGGFVVFAPMLGFALRKPSAFIGRGNDVTLLDTEVLRHSREKYRADGVGEVVLEQVRRTVLAFHVFGDESPQFSLQRPGVGAVTAALLVIGLGFSVRRLREPGFALIWLWLGLTLLLGGVFTADPPYWPHLNILLPAVAILSAYGADRLGVAVAGRGEGRRRAAFAVTSAIVLAAGVYKWRVYEDFADDNAEPEMRASRYLDDLPAGTRVFLVGQDVHANSDVFRFFNRGSTVTDATVAGLLDPGFRLERPAVILLRDGQGELPRIEERFPGGEVEELRRPGDEERAFLVYRLPAEERPSASTPSR
jgi:4-amino-4-deoxy-L-arabinose transferase-like glycosyltransferase